MMQAKINRPALRYPGGKFRDGNWIASLFPPHTCYAEPYGGGGSVLLLKQPSEFEFYNDLDGEVVNFFRVLRDASSELIRKIELTPYSREEQELSRFPAEDEIERARRFYVRSWQTVNGAEMRYNSGWRNQYKRNRSSVTREWSNTEHLWAIAWRLKQVQIEHRSALDLIRRIDTPQTLFYLDPPYVKSTRSQSHRDLYKFEMSDADHEELASVVHVLKGMVILSGYDSQLYRDLYSNFKLIGKKTTKSYGQTAVECLWLSPSVTNTTAQLSLNLDE